MDSWIYRIRNIANGRLYIGSAKSIKSRWRRHKKDLKRGKHHSVFLQRSWNKYGEGAFAFEVVESCSVDFLCIRENFYLKKHKPAYNNCPTAYCQIGRKLTKEHIQKITAYVRANGVRQPASTWEQKRKRVAMHDGDSGEIIQKFESLSHACRFLGRDFRFVSTISGCCTGKRKTAYGYKWSFI